MWYEKKDLGNRKQIYSLNEKKTNLRTKCLNNKNDLNLKKEYDDFNKLLKDKNSFGQVFVVKDSNFDSNALKYKTRQVVSLGVEKGYMTVVPVRKNKSIVKLSKFDNCRHINLNNAASIPLNNIYDKQDFKNTSNSSLSKREIAEIKRKLAGNYNY